MPWWLTFLVAAACLVAVVPPCLRFIGHLFPDQITAFLDKMDDLIELWDGIDEARKYEKKFCSGEYDPMSHFVWVEGDYKLKGYRLDVSKVRCEILNGMSYRDLIKKYDWVWPPLFAAIKVADKKGLFTES